MPSTYIFVFKYLNTSLAAIPKERVRKISRRLFTEVLGERAGETKRRIPCLPASPSPSRPALARARTHTHTHTHTLSLSLSPSVCCFLFPHFRAFRRLANHSERVVLFGLPVPRADVAYITALKRTRYLQKTMKNLARLSSSAVPFRRCTADYFYSCTQLFIVQRIIRSITGMRHSRTAKLSCAWFICGFIPKAFRNEIKVRVFKLQARVYRGRACLRSLYRQEALSGMADLKQH